jgi:ABC-type multidrug transport system permease subunit
VLLKEVTAGKYGFGAYLVAKTLCEIPVSIFMPFIFLATLWPLVGLPAAAFPGMFVAILLISWTSTSLAIMVGSMFSNDQNVVSIMTVVICLWEAAGGFFVDLKTQPQWISWIRFTSYFYYGMGLVVQSVIPFYDRESLDKGIEGYSFSLDVSAFTNALVLVFFCFLFRITGYIFLVTNRKMKLS